MLQVEPKSLQQNYELPCVLLLVFTTNDDDDDSAEMVLLLRRTLGKAAELIGRRCWSWEMVGEHYAVIGHSSNLAISKDKLR